ncbi:UNVERIFIED_CONTAM: hypothetical protein NCL1_32945 [Trichonephila clavipes]
MLSCHAVQLYPCDKWGMKTWSYLLSLQILIQTTTIILINIRKFVLLHTFIRKTKTVPDVKGVTSKYKVPKISMVLAPYSNFHDERDQLITSKKVLNNCVGSLIDVHSLRDVFMEIFNTGLFMIPSKISECCTKVFYMLTLGHRAHQHTTTGAAWGNSFIGPSAAWRHVPEYQTSSHRWRMVKYNPYMIIPKITQACSGIAAMFLFGYLWKADLQVGKNTGERQQMRFKQASSVIN